MLFLLSPAKSLDYDRPLPRGVRQRATEPLFLRQASALIDTLKPLPAQQVARLMDLSDDLARLNAARYAAWVPQHDDRNSRPAVLAFNGDVYDGLDVRSLQAADLAWAQDHVVILSGLYGALRPLDRLQPYRLEMGTRHANPVGKDLYAFWGRHRGVLPPPAPGRRPAPGGHQPGVAGVLQGGPAAGAGRTRG